MKSLALVLGRRKKCVYVFLKLFVLGKLSNEISEEKAIRRVSAINSFCFFFSNSKEWLTELDDFKF